MFKRITQRRRRTIPAAPRDSLCVCVPCPSVVFDSLNSSHSLKQITLHEFHGLPQPTPISSLLLLLLKHGTRLIFLETLRVIQMDSNVTAQTFKPQKFLFGLLSVPPVSLFYSIRDLSTGLRKDTVAWPSSAPTTQQRTNERKKNDRTHKTQFKFFFFLFSFSYQILFSFFFFFFRGGGQKKKDDGYMLYTCRLFISTSASDSAHCIPYTHDRKSQAQPEQQKRKKGPRRRRRRDTTRFFNTTFTFVHDGKYAKVFLVCAHAYPIYESSDQCVSVLCIIHVCRMLFIFIRPADAIGQSGQGLNSPTRQIRKQRPSPSSALRNSPQPVD